MKKIMSPYIVLSLLLCLFGNQSMAQDQQAKQLLDQLRDKYEAYTGTEVDFEVTLTQRDQSQDKQTGTLRQTGSMYRIDMESQSVISDGRSLWLHLKDRNEVQINDFEESEDFARLSPTELIKIYESDEYEYLSLGNGKKDEKHLHYIEFKPKDKYSEYSKMRLILDRKKMEITSFEVFSKDGSRYFLKINSIKRNSTIDKNIYIFVPEDHPNILIEDLRIE